MWFCWAPLVPPTAAGCWRIGAAISEQPQTPCFNPAHFHARYNSLSPTFPRGDTWFPKARVSGRSVSFFSLFFPCERLCPGWAATRAAAGSSLPLGLRRGWSRQEPPARSPPRSALGSRDRRCVTPAVVTGTALPAGPDGDHQFRSHRRWLLAPRVHCSALAGTN